jgi:alpha/beta superfamily hydrolase
MLGARAAHILIVLPLAHLLSGASSFIKLPLLRIGYQNIGESQGVFRTGLDVYFTYKQTTL